MMLTGILFLMTTAVFGASPVQISMVVNPEKRAVRHLEPRRLFSMGNATDVVLDGAPEEAFWGETPLAPPLRPFLDGLSPPALSVKLAMGAKGLYGWISELDPTMSVEILVDPTGVGQEWWVGTIQMGKDPLWQHCGVEAIEMPWDRFIPPSAYPCEEVIGGFRSAQSAGSAEWLFPAEDVGVWTTEMRVLLRVQIPSTTGTSIRSGGTWAQDGADRLLPAFGLRWKGPRHTRLSGGWDLDEGVWRGKLTVKPPVLDEDWVWRIYHLGQVIGEGQVSVPLSTKTQGEVSFLWEAQPLEGLRVGVYGSKTKHLVQSALTSIPRPLRGGTVAPICREAIEVTFRTVDPEPRTLLRLTNTRGREIRAEFIDLPRGEGVLRVPQERLPVGSIGVQLGNLLPDAAQCWVPPRQRESGVHP